MGTLNLNNFIFFLFFLLLTISGIISRDIRQKDQAAVAEYQVFFIKNAPPKPVMNKKKNMRSKRNKKARPFFAMLPKGRVPPSGSSNCHNEFPNSKNTLYCALSTQKP
ncbi:hypothetical protein M5689_009135 [Euphorbia peplus]|nr:hypothetical protein M5689_009135 [Euphorbia peplus]